MFADPEVFTCIKRYHIAHQNARNAGTFSPGLFLHAIMAEDSAFLPGAAPEGSLPGGDPSSTLPLIFTLQMPQEPLQLQSKHMRNAFHRSMRAVRNAETVINIYIGQRSKFFGKAKVIFFFFFMETQVLQH